MLPLKVKGRSCSRPLFQLLTASNVLWVRDGHLFPVSLYTVPVSEFPLFIRTTSHVGLKPTSMTSSLFNHLCKDCLQIRSHSKELGLKTLTSLSRKTQFNLYQPSSVISLTSFIIQGAHTVLNESFPCYPVASPTDRKGHMFQ